jgi:hypothetical protein
VSFDFDRYKDKHKGKVRLVTWVSMVCVRERLKRIGCEFCLVYRLRSCIFMNLNQIQL